MADEPSALAKRVAELVRQRALRAIVEHDASLGQVFDAIAEGVRRDLRATGFTIAQVREVLEKHFASTSAERVRIVEDAILSAAREARVMPQETFDAIYGREAAAEAGAPFDRASSPMRTRLLQLVRESVGEPPSTD